MADTTMTETTHSLGHDFMTGLRCRCPACGKGKMFKSYLKVNDTCPNCGEELFHQRADDLPAYYVIMIVGHTVVVAATTVEVAFSPSYWVHAALWLPLTLIMALGLLQPIKGAAIAVQWHNGMHGFAKSRNKQD